MKTLYSHTLDAGNLKIKGPISSDPREVGLHPCVSDGHLLCHMWPFLGLHECDEREEFSLWVSEERQWPHDKTSSIMSHLVTKGLIHKHYIYTVNCGFNICAWGKGTQFGFQAQHKQKRYTGKLGTLIICTNSLEDFALRIWVHWKMVKWKIIF